MNARMVELAAEQPGFLGRESGTWSDGTEMTVVYFTDEESLRTWRLHPEHLEAQRLGRERWYSSYNIQVARGEREHGFTRDVPADEPRH